MESMFEELNKNLKKELIELYKGFVQNTRDKKYKESAAIITEKYANTRGHVNRKLSDALQKAYDLELEGLPIEEVKEILLDLQSI